MANGTFTTIKKSSPEKGSFSAYHVRPVKSIAKGGIVILQKFLA